MKLGNIILVIATVFSFGCSGTGEKIPTRSEPAVIGSNSQGSVYVARKSQGYGSGQIFQISLNGETLGDLGIGEYVSAELSEGVNVLKVKLSGILGAISIGANSPSKSFVKNGNENRYFVTWMGLGFSPILEINEVTETDWYKSGSFSGP